MQSWANRDATVTVCFFQKEDGSMLRSLWKLLIGTLSLSSNVQQPSCRSMAWSTLMAMLAVVLLEGRCLPSGRIVEFPVPTSSSYPCGIVTGPDGNLWFTEDQAHKI